MRVWLSLVVVLASSLAFAEPKTRFVVGTESEAVRAAFTADVIAKLDACWTKAARAKANITFFEGKVTSVKLSKNGDPKAAKCLTAVLQSLTLATPARIVAPVELDATPPKPIAVLTDKNKKALDQILDKNLTTLQTNGSGSGGPGGTGTGVSTPAKDAPKVEVEVGPDTKLDGKIPRDEIGRVIKARAGVFRACYERELNRNAKVRDGKVVIEIQIAEDGSVQTAHLMSSRINAPDVDRCLVSNVLRLKFPKASASTTVTYPFIFTRG